MSARVGKYRYLSKNGPDPDREMSYRFTSMKTEDCYDSDDYVEDMDRGICVNCKKTTIVVHLGGSKKNLCRMCLEDETLFDCISC